MLAASSPATSRNRSHAVEGPFFGGRFDGRQGVKEGEGEDARGHVRGLAAPTDQAVEKTLAVEPFDQRVMVERLGQPFSFRVPEKVPDPGPERPRPHRERPGDPLRYRRTHEAEQQVKKTYANGDLEYL